MNPEWIGLLAAALTTCAYIPQAMKVVREKNTQSISLVMYLMMTIGIALWCIYGMMIGSLSLILANGITFVLALTILLMKLRHG